MTILLKAKDKFAFKKIFAGFCHGNLELIRIRSKAYKFFNLPCEVFDKSFFGKFNSF
jgi:hypothetical protein